MQMIPPLSCCQKQQDSDVGDRSSLWSDIGLFGRMCNAIIVNMGGHLTFQPIYTRLNGCVKYFGLPIRLVKSQELCANVSIIYLSPEFISVTYHVMNKSVWLFGISAKHISNQSQYNWWHGLCHDKLIRHIRSLCCFVASLSFLCHL